MATIHPTPSGTRDVLPDEMSELRAITDAMRTVFAQHGYGEIWTPSIEFASVASFDHGRVYKLFDDHGDVLQLRSDLTVPIARVAATRYADAEPPLRFCCFAHVYRGVVPHRGLMRESLHADCELIGAERPAGTVEILTVLCAALDAVGLSDYRIGLGDAALLDALCDVRGVSDVARAELLAALLRRDFVALAAVVDAHGLDPALADVPQRRGGADVLDDLGEAGGRLRAVLGALPADVAARVILDLGLTRDPDYYTGAVFEVYDPAGGQPIGGGGRYDDLVGRFGRDLPAVGFSLALDQLHEALAGTRRGER